MKKEKSELIRGIQYQDKEGYKPWNEKSYAVERYLLTGGTLMRGLTIVLNLCLFQATISDDVKARIERNKKLAMERRAAKLTGVYRLVLDMFRYNTIKKCY